MKRLGVVDLGTAVVAALVLLVSTAGTASAAPTASFTVSRSSPRVGQTVKFTFTGTCDVAPCRIQWRAYRQGGSRLGTTMGEGAILKYIFTTVGTYTVVVKITNSTSTHGSATASRVMIVRPALLL